MRHGRSQAFIRAAVITMAVSALPSAKALADPIVYTEQTVADGLFGNGAFGTSLVTISVTADTAGVDVISPTLATNTGVGTIAIAGGPTATFNDPLVAFVNGSSFGIADAAVQRDVVDTVLPSGPAYNLDDNLGPFTGQAYFSQYFQFETSIGVFELASFPGTSTFEATVTDVPEPTSGLMLAVGLAALSISCRASFFKKNQQRPFMS